MAGPKIAGLEKLIAEIAQHVVPLPPESASPIEHYRRGANDAANLVQYFHRNMKRTNVYAAPYERHARRLHSMVLLTLVETFERFLKELAAICVDHVGPLVVDKRLKEFAATGPTLSLSVGDGTLGWLLCEPLLWHDVEEEVENRFRKLLHDESLKATFVLFPGGKDSDAWRRSTLQILFQIRHSIVHNASVLNRSDAAKLRILTRAKVEAPRVLAPTDKDLWYAKAFLDETATWCDERVLTRLVAVLEAIHSRDATLFDPQQRATRLAKEFGRQVKLAAATGSP